ncbi:hypothetical protein LOAG_16816 [Loa loa]|uniref:Uncharacterized protein n=1 Tax=Loa loa TaxID=7209 RepID=A0A1I7VPZ3_LOALO|nr:hypothetical protein LOAG_16816 [Loa loa]EJD76181.1 hypothetical protein LOAG_16816 [Loa loa]
MQRIADCSSSDGIDIVGFCRQAVVMDRERARADERREGHERCTAMRGAARKKCAERKLLTVKNRRKRSSRQMAQQSELLDSLVGENDSRSEIFRKLLKHEQRETPPRLSPAVDGLSNDSSVSTDNSNSNDEDTGKPCVLLPKSSDDNQGSLLDRKDEIQRLLSKTTKQEMPQLDNECQNAACGQDNGTDPESAATSSVHSDDTPPRLTAAQVSSSFSSSLMDGEESRGEYCDDNASPPPLDKYASATSSPIVPGSKARDSTVWTLRLRRRPFHTSLLSAASEAGPSVNKKSCSETDWANRLAEVLRELHPSQLVLAKETIHSTVVKILAQEIASDISCLMNLIENHDRRAAAFERVLKDLKKFKADYTYDSTL